MIREIPMTSPHQIQSSMAEFGVRVDVLDKGAGSYELQLHTSRLEEFDITIEGRADRDGWFIVVRTGEDRRWKHRAAGMEDTNGTRP